MTATTREREQLVKKLEVFTDSEEEHERCGDHGMRLHAHSRGQVSVALSSCAAEVIAASEGINEGLLLQEVLMFAGLGHYVIEVKMDSSAAHAFFHRRGVGRMKHIDVENLVASRLDRCGRCEIEEDTANTELGRHVDAYTKCERIGGLSAVDGSPVLQWS